MLTYAEAADRRHLQAQSAIIHLLAEHGPLTAAEISVSLSAAGMRMGVQGWSSAAHLRELRRDGLVERSHDALWSVVIERCAGLDHLVARESVPAWQAEEWGLIG